MTSKQTEKFSDKCFGIAAAALILANMKNSNCKCHTAKRTGYLCEPCTSLRLIQEAYYDLQRYTNKINQHTVML